MKGPVGIGVMGTGYWGSKLIDEYKAAEQNNRNVRLLKVCDPSSSALQACKHRFSLDDSLLTQNPNDVFEDSEVSGVHIATPNRTHYALARSAIESGKNALIEKPMTLKSRDAYQLTDLAFSRDLVLHVGHIFRHNAALQAAKHALERDAVGKVYYARVQWTDYTPPFHDRDIVFDLGPHPVDILNLLLGAWPTQASGIGRAYRSSREEDEVAYIIAEFQGDLFAHIELSWLHPSKHRDVSIVGSDGALLIDCINQRVVRFSNGDKFELPVIPNNTIKSEIEAFVQSISNHSVTMESGQIGAHTVEVLETITESMWDRPLPPIKQYKADQTTALTAVLEMARQNICALRCGMKDCLASEQMMKNPKLQKYLDSLINSNFLKAISTKEGTKLEVTEDGMRFLREYQEIEPSLDLIEQNRTLKKTTTEIN